MFDGCHRGDPGPGANTVHVNECRRVAKVDDDSGAGANLSYQSPRKPPIVLYLVHICRLSLKAGTGCRHRSLAPPASQIRTESGERRLKDEVCW